MKKIFMPLVLVAISVSMTGCFTLIETIASSSRPVMTPPATTVVVSQPQHAVVVPAQQVVTTTVHAPASRPTETTVIVNQTYDYYRSLDLRAVAAAFAEARNVREFEQMLNSSRYMVSNLDLNRDGWIDYLRVMETRQGWTHVLYIQAVLGMNVFQNVATVVVEVHPNSRYAQIIGDPYIYGANYYVDPVFRATPPMYSYMYTTGAYTCWSSPYYWNNYPSYYTHPQPVVVTHYEAYVTTYLCNHNYCREAYYASQPHYAGYQSIGSSVSRHDYSTAHPTQSFQQNYSQSSARAFVQAGTGVSTRQPSNGNVVTATTTTSSASTRQPSNTTTTTTTTSSSASTRQPSNTTTTTTTTTSSSASTRQPSNTTTTTTSSSASTRQPSSSSATTTTTTSSRVQSNGRTTTRVTEVNEQGKKTVTTQRSASSSTSSRQPSSSSTSTSTRQSSGSSRR